MILTQILQKLKKKQPSITGLVTTAALNTKVTEIENIIPDTSGLVKKAIYDVKIKETVDKIHSHGAFITTPEFNRLTKKISMQEWKR